MSLANFGYPGHTEFLTKEFEAKESLMFMVSDSLKVGLVTNHLPLSQVTSAITKEKIITKLILMDKSLKEDLGIEKPRIALLALNPHAGDGGNTG